MDQNSSPEIPTERASLELLYHTSREFASALDLKVVLQRVLYLSVQYAGAMSGSILVLDDQGVPVDSALIFGKQFRDHSTQQLQVTLESGLAGWVARTRTAALVLDTSQDERWVQLPDDSPAKTGPKSAVSAPILAHAQLVGVITLVHPEPGTLTNDHLELVQAIAGQAGVAIHHAQLYQSLQTAHQRYRELFEDSINPIFVTDWQGAIIEANRAALISSGLVEGTLLGANIFDLHTVSWEAVGDKFTRLVDGRTANYESTVKNALGRNFPVQVQVHRILIDGQPHLQWIMRDITERKDLDRLREDLVSMIYHDLRSPLSNIVSSMDILDTLLDGSPNDGPRALVNIAMRSTERIERLTESLLDISRLEAGQPLGERQW
ncbi:MAG TPA: GAF domain-containing protein, partial [Anaerolineales bacterium]|nr:GAF domain-containing protein [Anaerolineales bacterium]